MSAQLDLFKSNDEISLMQKEITDIKTQTNNVRRGMFARHTELSQIILEQQKRLEQLEDQIKCLLN
jgi:hypothetical protein